MRTGLIVAAAGAGVVAFFVWKKRASAATSGGAPGFVAPPTPGAPVTVVGCSFARAGGVLIDVMSGKELSEEEGARRSKVEGCPLPPKPTKATKPGQSLFAAGGK
jgi:hypothetical protein